MNSIMQKRLGFGISQKERRVAVFGEDVDDGYAKNSAKYDATKECAVRHAEDARAPGRIVKGRWEPGQAISPAYEQKTERIVYVRAIENNGVVLCATV
jgi:hypothetical protein